MRQQILINKTVKQSVWWWTRVLSLKRHQPIVPPQLEIITSDASLQGWGAHYRDHAAQGRWHFQPQGIVLNILELRAAFQALLAFSPFLGGKKCPTTHGQQGGGSLHTETGWHQEQHTHE